MKFFKSARPVAAAVGAAIITAGPPKGLNISEPSSIQSVAKTIAADTMRYYHGNAKEFVDLDAPYYWWECGALMGAMLDYSHYTNDTTYDKTIATALLAQVGPEFNYMLPEHFGDEGNDDLAFWGFAVMSAAERNFPQPESSIPPWLNLGENIWNSLASRWNTTHCGGGLLWQIFASNPNGLDYKNTVSNGGFFQLSARLARATGNQTYLDWANKVWDWTKEVGMIDEEYNVLDGASARKNCKDVNPVSFSYSASIYMYGAAVLADHTKDPKWTERTTRILEAARSFFSPFENATNIMYEHACEQVDKCNVDMRSFKGYFSRFTYASALYVPSILPTVTELLHTSAAAAAKSCTGGKNGTSCGHKWYVGGFDGQTGLGEEMCALETIHGLLVDKAPRPFKGEDIKVIRTFATPSPTATPSTNPNPKPDAAGPAATPEATQSSAATQRRRRR
ncbi:glycoside hydrolase [Podospora didyma]|uniref:Mannan endo-1,6-alpha-mannosidase n=1 Tax=Podospora didyma TaxID=330526 RepID=A0AAE0NYY2_9PEZI|nr:glycoside hydrolase [Podospora didyma]